MTTSSEPDSVQQPINFLFSELLLGLIGHTGGAFRPTEQDPVNGRTNRTFIPLTCAVDWLSSSERLVSSGR